MTRHDIDGRTERVRQIWSKVLCSPELGIDDDFFLHGGDSLAALRVASGLHDEFGVSVGLQMILDARTPRRLAAALTNAAPTEPSLADMCARAAANPDAPFPLTPVQEAYWLGRRSVFEMGARGTASYVEVDVPDLDLARLRRAVDSLIARHAMLRVVFLDDGRQVCRDDVPPFPLAVDDLGNSPDEDVQRRLAQTRETMSQQDIDPGAWPLFRLHVTRWGKLSRLHLLIELLICDAASIRILLRELAGLYRDTDLVLPPLAFDFASYVRTLSMLRTSPLFERDRRYWQKRLPDLPPPPELPLARNPDDIGRPVFHRRAFRLEAAAWTKLKAAAAERGLTATAVIGAAYAEALAVYARAPRFTVNVTTYQRLPMHRDVECIVGDFTSVSLLAIDARADSFETLAASIQRRLWEDMDHGLYSGVDVIRELRRRDSLPTQATMPIVFTSMLGQGEDEADRDAREWLGEGVFGAAGTPQVWIDHQINDYGELLEVRWDSVDALFPAGVIDGLFAHYTKRIQKLAEDAAAWLAPVGRRATAFPPPPPPPPAIDATLLSGFLQAVDRAPEVIACVDASGEMTGRSLALAVMAVARALQRCGIRPGEPVAVGMEKGRTQAIALLAVIRLGCSYVAVDTAWPPSRLRSALRAGGTAWLLTDDPEVVVPEGVRVIDPAHLDVPGGTPDCPLPEAGALAYIIFTSGTTGEPKGVQIDHRGATNTLQDINRRFDIGRGDKVLALSSLTFDLSVYDVFGTLAAGATVVYPPPNRLPDPAAWSRCLDLHNVTVWNSAPALMQLLVEEREAAGAPPATALRLVLLSGDWIPVDLVQRVRALFPSARIVSLGGATEASIWSVFYEIGEIDPNWRRIPYGAALSGQSVHVLDDELHDVPDWVTGELYIGGAGLAMGYAGDQRLTAERFITRGEGQRLYRTGDLVRRREDGQLELLGRVDDQIKVRGIRVDPREIEWALAQHPQVSAAAVVPVDPNGRSRLAAFVVTDTPDNGQDALARLRFLLEDRGARQADARGAVIVSLPPASVPPVGRRSRRRFMRTPLPLSRLSDWLAPLRAHEVPGMPLPKYRYPSAGTLYSVQTYLSVPPGGVAGLDGGVWYHDRRTHQLVKVAPVPVPGRAHATANLSFVEDAACTVFMVMKAAAIVPVYAENSAAFAMLEAGHMGQLLADGASAAGLGTCAIGSIDSDLVKDYCRTDTDDIVLHAIAMGLPDGDEAWGSAEPVKRSKAPSPSAGELREWLREHLPAQLAQLQIQIISAMPVTANGKVDRAALAAMAEDEERRPSHESRIDAELTEMERRVAAIWQQLLNIEKVGLDQSFFDLGGDSMLLVRMHRHLIEAIGVDLPVEALFEHYTVRRLAAALAAHAENGPAAETRADARRLQRERRRRGAATQPQMDHGREHD
ncbi:MAG: amino acid adenylation domain-containing protein [Proteobacteria bacterium]|nr:amino acid adenylation domain-containing protein [Pseudomonadota bacterium]